MVSEKQLKDTLEKKFRQIWEKKSFLAKRARQVQPKERLPLRTFGIRYLLPKTVTDNTVEEIVDKFIKREQQKGFIETNDGEFFIKKYPTFVIMLETFDETGKSKLLFENPVVAVFVEAGFLPKPK